MKRLTRQERAGVLVLAAVSLATVGGAWLIRTRSVSGGLSDDVPAVTVLYRDSTALAGESAGGENKRTPAREVRKRHKASANDTVSGSRSGKKRGRSRKSAESGRQKPNVEKTQRDPLSEPVSIK